MGISLTWKLKKKHTQPLEYVGLLVCLGVAIITFSHDAVETSSIPCILARYFRPLDSWSAFFLFLPFSLPSPYSDVPDTDTPPEHQRSLGSNQSLVLVDRSANWLVPSSTTCIILPHWNAKTIQLNNDGLTVHRMLNWSAHQLVHTLSRDQQIHKSRSSDRQRPEPIYKIPAHIPGPPSGRHAASGLLTVVTQAGDTDDECPT